MDEFSFVEKLKEIFATDTSDVLVGIGDDCAVIKTPNASSLLFCADLLTEGIHFNAPTSEDDWRKIGYKALAVNLSDIAAMGGSADFATVSLALPARHGARAGILIAEGIAACARKFGVKVVGGDTSSACNDLTIDVALVGRAPQDGAIKRSTAKAGDLIYVSGPLGGSLTHGRHLTFTPRLAFATELLRIARPSAMIDISDGFLNDLGHICRQSGLGATLNLADIPIHADAKSTKNPLDGALNDGEDFELCFCMTPADVKKLAAHDEWPDDAKPICVGEMQSAEGIFGINKNGNKDPLKNRGYQHEIKN